MSLDLTPTPFLGGTLVSTTPFLILPFTADAAGSFSLLAFPGGGGPLTVYAQGVYGDPNTPFGVGITNGLSIQFLP